MNPRAIQNDTMRVFIETAVDLGETAVVRSQRLWKDLTKVRLHLCSCLPASCVAQPPCELSRPGKTLDTLRRGGLPM